MSIYPVRLSEWFPPNDAKFEILNAVLRSSRCTACDKRLRYKAAVGHHSVPYGCGELWCSWKCCNSGLEASVDPRRQRRINRRIAKKY